jgi:eukaryotic-like serine/threonine-protein kinase
MRTVRVFVSSPGDVPDERLRVQMIAQRLSGEFSEVLRFETVLWESKVYSAQEGGFQPQIEQLAKPAECDIVIAIFWSRLGTPLPDAFPARMPDGKAYPSGTAYEVLSALEARRANGRRPDVYVFRKSTMPIAMVPINDKEAVAEASRQWQLLEDFFTHWFETADKRILRVAEKFRDLRDFDQKIERLLRDWVALNLPQRSVWPIEIKGSPFRGLEPFDAKHADVFCGRDRKVLRAIDELVSAARRGKPFLLIPGASGTGKSSLMRAGIAPRLTRPGAVAGVDRWRAAVMRPATDASQAIARALFVTADTDQNDDPGGFGKALPELSNGPFKSPDRLANLFARAPESAVELISAALNDIGTDEAARCKSEQCQVNLLLLVDQFEDIFASAVTPEQRTAFANLIATFVSTRRIWVIVTLRGDMYERMITERAFIALKDMGGQFDLAPPGPDELDEIIHKSAEAAGLRYEDANGARLDDWLLRDAAGENTLPLLEFVLNLLFEKCCVHQHSTTLTMAAYGQIGGLDGAINQMAEMALVALVRPGQEIGDPFQKRIQDDIARTVNPTLERLLRTLTVSVGPQQRRTGTAGTSTLAGRLVAIDEVVKDEPTRRLVEALLQARILVAPKTKQGSLLRIAHERVLTSWTRARDLVERNREFFRIREYIENQRARWEESGERREFLIPAGAPIAEAEEKVRQFRDGFSPASVAFVAASGRRARRRQQWTAAAAITFGIVALTASALGLIAYAAEQESSRNYAAAKGAADNLVVSIAKQLRDLEGVNSQLLDTVFGVVRHLIGDIQKAVQEDERPLMRRVRPALAVLEAWMTSKAAVEDKLAALDYSRAKMLLEFAETYHRFGQEPTRANKMAEQSLAIQQQLRGARNASPDLLWHISRSHQELADLARKRIEQQGATNFYPVRVHLDEALRLRQNLFSRFPEHPDRLIWGLGIAQALTRLGDIDLKESKEQDAARHYEQEYAVSVQVFLLQESDIGSIRELAWSYRKIGEASILLRHAYVEALSSYADELCVRRHLVDQTPDNTEFRRDLGFSLIRTGSAMLKATPPDLSASKDAVYEAIHVRRRLADSDRRKRSWQEELADSFALAADVHRADQRLDLALVFEAAAADIREKIKATFRDEESAKQVANARKRLDQASHQLGPGAQAFVGAGALAMVDTEEARFTQQPSALQRSSEGCWDRLKQRIGEQVSRTASTK